MLILIRLLMISQLDAIALTCYGPELSESAEAESSKRFSLS